MTAKEMRACMLSFRLHNQHLSSMRLTGIEERPPFFFVATDKLNGKLGDDQTVICLPLWPLLKYTSDMEEAVEELINYIMPIQDEGPYLLGGYCNGGYVAYEIARRLAFAGVRSSFRRLLLGEIALGFTRLPGPPHTPLWRQIRCAVLPDTRLEGIGQGWNRGARGEGRPFYGYDQISVLTCLPD
jgi:hypothetical protein